MQGVASDGEIESALVDAAELIRGVPNGNLTVEIELGETHIM